MNLRKRLVFGACILTLIVTLVYVIVQIMNYQLLPVGTIKPVYQVDGSTYFCDPGKGDRLIRKSENGEEVIVDEKVHNYCLKKDLLFYSTKTGIYVCNADGACKEKVASFSKRADSFEENYGNFFLKDDLFFFTYECSGRECKVVWYCAYDKSKDFFEILDKRSFDIEKTLTAASSYSRNTVLWKDRESCFLYQDSSIFRLDFKNYTMEELYRSSEDMVIENACYYPENDCIVFYAHNKNQICFGEFQVENKTVSKRNMKKVSDEFVADPLIYNESLFCLQPSGAYFCINMNGEENSGYISLFEHGVYHSYFDNDCIMIYNTFRYDAASYQIIKLQAENLEESDRIEKVSLWGRLKSYKAK